MDINILLLFFMKILLTCCMTNFNVSSVKLLIELKRRSMVVQQPSLGIAPVTTNYRNKWCSPSKYHMNRAHILKKATPGHHPLGKLFPQRVDNPLRLPCYNKWVISDPYLISLTFAMGTLWTRVELSSIQVVDQVRSFIPSVFAPQEILRFRCRPH